MAQSVAFPEQSGADIGEDGAPSRAGPTARIKGHLPGETAGHDMASLLADHRRAIARGVKPADDGLEPEGERCGRRSGPARPGGPCTGRTRAVHARTGADLSQDLHDCGGYHLSLLQISLKLLEAFVSEGRGRAHLDRTKAQLARFAADLGSIAALQAKAARLPADPHPADPRDLDAFLAETLNVWSMASGLPVDFACDRPRLRLPLSAEQPLLRVLQECLTNILKHARTASRVAVALRVRRGILTLTVADDGCGFDSAHLPALRRGSPEGALAGLGLPGMAARMAGIGGRLTVESARGHGTRISARLPLPA